MLCLVTQPAAVLNRSSGGGLWSRLVQFDTVQEVA